ncbi:hypothetical protein JO972_10305 [Verrucomicrobiaceae bacterium 5K15]|uniref:Uncharacterized protein n=1 Tax=Oceaniferula flava TaxID=2800421 RepID=A0AAE2SFF2_9BACT|nr:hypothetical protein [Oceaniferula flavus]MBK1855351.1 hypothetical protein [Oceaniferula flavus]MBM1136657.1 hypothetical protein [Oceaniferula flavus]
MTAVSKPSGRNRPELWLYSIAMFGPAFLAACYFGLPDSLAPYIRWILGVHILWMLLGACYCSWFNATDEGKGPLAVGRAILGLVMNGLMQVLLHIATLIIGAGILQQV